MPGSRCLRSAWESKKEMATLFGSFGGGHKSTNWKTGRARAFPTQNSAKPNDTDSPCKRDGTVDTEYKRPPPDLPFHSLYLLVVSIFFLFFGDSFSSLASFYLFCRWFSLVCARYSQHEPDGDRWLSNERKKFEETTDECGRHSNAKWLIVSVFFYFLPLFSFFLLSTRVTIITTPSLAFRSSCDLIEKEDEQDDDVDFLDGRHNDRQSDDW